MGNEFVSCTFFLLLLVMHASGNAAEEMDDAGGNVLRLPRLDVARQTGDVNHAPVGENHDVKHAHHEHPHSSTFQHMANMDPSLMMFFVINDLKFGKTIPVYFPTVDPSNSFNFLPKEKADSIPFSPNALPYLLQLFSISQDSPQAKAMEETLSLCDDHSETVKGETKFCATSLESLLGQAGIIFGSQYSGVQILTTSHSHTSNTKSASPQNYTIVEQPKGIAAPKMIACHSMAYPYTVYYCHNPEGKTKVFKVALVGESGDRVGAVSVCHMDTSQWDPDHVSFRVLAVKPGSSEVCHFFPTDNLLLLPY